METLNLPKTKKVFISVRPDAPFENYAFSVRSEHLTGERWITDKDGKYIRKDDGDFKTEPVFVHRPIDVVKGERYFTGPKDLEGSPRNGKVHELTEQEFEWLRREIECHVIRYENRALTSSRGIGPGGQHARCSIIRRAKQDPDGSGRLIPLPSYRPATGGIGADGALVACDEELKPYITIRAADQRDETPAFVPDSATPDKTRWDDLDAESATDGNDTIAKLKARIAELEANQVNAPAEVDGKTTRRGRPRKNKE